MGMVIGGIVAVIVAFFVVMLRKLGRSTRTPNELAAARILLHLRHGDPAAVWSKLGSATRAEGLNLWFDADDDPAAKAVLHLPDADAAAPSMANVQKIRLTREYASHHVASGKYAAMARIRGSDAVVGRMVKLQMLVTTKGAPLGVCIENDEDDDPAMGGWVEIHELAILAL